MKAVELRDKSVVELRDLLEKELRARFALRVQHASGQLGAHSDMKKNRRNIARIITLLQERMMAEVQVHE